MIVQPETALRWQRKRFRRYWRQLSQRKGPGRRALGAEIRALVDKMAAANPPGGAPGIHGEILKLGIDVSERTLSGLMPRRSERPSQTWRTFLANYVGSLISLHFFTVLTARLRVLLVLVVLVPDRRRVTGRATVRLGLARRSARQVLLGRGSRRSFVNSVRVEIKGAAP